MPRWTTARAVSGLADLRFKVVSPTLEPSNERTGRVASSERIVDLGKWVLVGLVSSEMGRVWFEKMEDERNEIEDGGVINEAIVVLWEMKVWMSVCYPVRLDSRLYRPIRLNNKDLKLNKLKHKSIPLRIPIIM